MVEKNIIKYVSPIIYDKIFSKSPFYNETLKMINKKIGFCNRKLYKNNKREKFIVIEPGFGTGNLTLLLIENKNIQSITAIDIDLNSSKYAQEKIVKNKPKIDYEFKWANAISYKQYRKVDLIAMSFIYHEISDNNKLIFIENMYNLLKKGGIIIIGDKFINNYKTENDRNIKMKDFANYRKKVYKKIVKDSIVIDEKKIPIADIFEVNEDNVLKEGLLRDGDWKTSVNELNNYLSNVGFINITNEEIVPKNINELNKRFGKKIDTNKMGYKIITAKKSSS